MQKQQQSIEKWRQIFSDQKEQKLTNAQVATIQGVSVAGLQYWRLKLKKHTAETFESRLVEVSSALAVQPLRVILPNGIRLEISASFPMEKLGSVVGQLRAL